MHQLDDKVFVIDARGKREESLVAFLRTMQSRRQGSVASISSMKSAILLTEQNLYVSYHIIL